MLWCSIPDVLATSYRDFHVKGFDYVCLSRSDQETLKLYTFTDEAANSHEVVSPHDHRYDFETTVLEGTLHNLVYIPNRHGGQEFYRHNYRTPLNGGDGFEFAGKTQLSLIQRDKFRPGETCQMLAEEIHTIQVNASSVLLLRQHEDRNVPATAAYSHLKKMPNLDGLYTKFTEGQLIDHLRAVCKRINAGLAIREGSFGIDHPSIA